MGKLIASGTDLPDIGIEPRFIEMDAVKAYAELTEDVNPLHTDYAFAATTQFGAPIVIGTHALAPIWEAIEAVLGRGQIEGTQAHVRFVSPVIVGSTTRYDITAIAGDEHDHEVTVQTEKGIGAIVKLSLPTNRG